MLVCKSTLPSVFFATSVAKEMEADELVSKSKDKFLTHNAQVLRYLVVIATAAAGVAVVAAAVVDVDIAVELLLLLLLLCCCCCCG